MTILKFDAPPTLLAFLQSDERVRLILGPYGSGKSSVCNFEILRRACETTPCPDGIRRSRFAVIRNTYVELRDTTIRTFKQWVPESLGDKRKGTNGWHSQENTFYAKFDDVEFEVMFRALDRPDDARKLLSLELTGAYINEAREVPQVILTSLMGRIGRYPSRKDLAPNAPDPWRGVWMDSNPPDTDHWMYLTFEELKPPGHVLFRQPGGRSPFAENLNNLVRGYYDDLAAVNSAKPEWVKVYVDGEYGFVVDGKPIYPEYQDAIHCREVVPNPKLPILLGQDFGLTPAAVFVQLDPRDNQVQVFDELTSESMGASTFAEELRLKLRGEYAGFEHHGWGDPAGEQRAQTDEKTPFDVLRAAGLNYSPAPTNDWIRRREAVAFNLRRLTMLGRPGIVVDPRCKRLRKGFLGGYSYRRLQVAGTDRFADKPDKSIYSHVSEALQYALVGEGMEGSAVDGVEPGRVVRCRVIRAKGH